MDKSIRKVIFQKNKLAFVATVVTVILKSGVDSLVAVVFKMALDMAASDSYGYTLIIKLAVSVVILYIVVGLLMIKSFKCYKIKAMDNYRNSFIDRILKTRICDMQNVNQGVLLSAIINDMKTIEDFYIEGIINVISYAARIILCGTLMVIFSFQMTFVIVLFIFVPFMIMRKLNRKFVQQKKLESDVAAEFNVMIKELLSGFAVIKSFCIEKIIAKDVEEKSLIYEKTKAEAFETINWMDIVTTSLVLICMLITFCWGAFLTKKGVITIGTVTAVAQLMTTIFSSVNPLTKSYSRVKGSKAILDKLDNLTRQTKEKILSGKTTFEKCIELRKLSFCYHKENYVIKDIDFVFEKNKSYAIVGESGCGKTTLIQLLNGYYDNYDGDIRIDGVNVKDISSMEIGQIISIIQQEVFMFDDNVENNITLRCNYPKEEVEKVIKRIGMHHFIGENASQLSGGQRQRISIGRALLRNTPVMLLDEVTSALDLNMAKSIEELILSLDHVTRIVITHRLEKKMLMQYDEILVMKNGVIEEHGKFESLIENRRLFYSMYHTYDIN